MLEIIKDTEQKRVEFSVNMRIKRNNGKILNTGIFQENDKIVYIVMMDIEEEVK